MASANSTDKLIIFKGDDTGGVFGRRLAFTIEAGDGVDLSGCRAEWIFDGIVKTFPAPLVNGETREVFYSHNETRCMALGVRYGTFRIIDAAGKVRTLTNTKPVEVTNDAARCYPGASDASFVVHGIGDMKHIEFADLEEKEGMTLNEVGIMVNTLIRKLKGTVSAFASILAFGAFADGAITPQTDFGDISPTAKLKAVVEASGAISGIDTNAVDALANSAVVTNALTVATTNRVASLETAKADKSTTYTKDETDSLLSDKLSKNGGIISGSLIIGDSSVEDDESLSAENGIRANGGFSRFSYSWYGNPKLKWMGEYFEDSMSRENGRIYIPYTDAPWIDAIKEGSVKGLALYSDLDGFLKSESDPVFTAWRDNSFSNAVLAVGLNIDTNSVAVLNEIADTFGGFPVEGTATTVGGLLAALAAAVAWLKKNKVSSFESVGGATATVGNGIANLSDFFTESNSLLNGRLAYSRNETGLKDRAFNTLSFDGTEYNLSTALADVTPTASGQPRDLLIVATATAATTISFTAGTIKGDKPTIDGSGTWLITLTEYAANTWYCRQIKMEDAA